MFQDSLFSGCDINRYCVWIGHFLHLCSSINSALPILPKHPLLKYFSRAALGVSKSSVSLWVRDIELTTEQQEALKEGQKQYGAAHKGSKAVAAKYREIRRQYQEEGRAKAREGDPLHLAGCMLYRAEGTKTRNALEFGNSDPAMALFYVRFLRECLNIDGENITVRIRCYLGNGLTLKEIEDYWLNLLDLPRSCIRQAQVNQPPKSSQQRGRKLKYGVCVIERSNTRVVQHVFGAIQEYIGVDKPKWLG